MGAALLATGRLYAQVAATSQVAAAPPMGWNSWDSYGLTVNEGQFRENVSAQVAKLKASGWTYSVIDEGWFMFNPQDRGTPEKLQYLVDDNGRYLPVPERFASATVAGKNTGLCRAGALGARAGDAVWHPHCAGDSAREREAEYADRGLELPCDGRGGPERRVSVGPYQLGYPGHAGRASLVRFPVAPICGVGRGLS